jgi:hypothetical protein
MLARGRRQRPLQSRVDAMGGGRQMKSAYTSIKRGLEQAIRRRKRNPRRRSAKPGEGLAEFVRRSPLAGTKLDLGRRRNTKTS